ncbi:hypothetical protein DFH07DRAFT_968658 [Mycena maculata]|uniref:JmjC domain-containing protein n=1 Tax=Mycena maculata TaxID=230809 RepID=A0AAD7HZV7_9AGAR|nr:hypothetical protein DFH07DRAFT_968658 [Mycena maculata]
MVNPNTSNPPSTASTSTLATLLQRLDRPYIFNARCPWLNQDTADNKLEPEAIVPALRKIIPDQAETFTNSIISGNTDALRVFFSKTPTARTPTLDYLRITQTPNPQPPAADVKSVVPALVLPFIVFDTLLFVADPHHPAQPRARDATRPNPGITRMNKSLGGPLAQWHKVLTESVTAARSYLQGDSLDIVSNKSLQLRHLQQTTHDTNPGFRVVRNLDNAALVLAIYLAGNHEVTDELLVAATIQRCKARNQPEPSRADAATALAGTSEIRIARVLTPLFVAVAHSPLALISDQYTYQGDTWAPAHGLIQLWISAGNAHRLDRSSPLALIETKLWHLLVKAATGNQTVTQLLREFIVDPEVVRVADQPCDPTYRRALVYSDDLPEISELQILPPEPLDAEDEDLLYASMPDPKERHLDTLITDADADDVRNQLQEELAEHSVDTQPATGTPQGGPANGPQESGPARGTVQTHAQVNTVNHDMHQGETQVDSAQPPPDMETHKQQEPGQLDGSPADRDIDMPTTPDAAIQMHPAFHADKGMQTDTPAELAAAKELATAKEHADIIAGTFAVHAPVPPAPIISWARPLDRKKSPRYTRTPITFTAYQPTADMNTPITHQLQLTPWNGLPQDKTVLTEMLSSELKDAQQRPLLIQPNARDLRTHLRPSTFQSGVAVATTNEYDAITPSSRQELLRHRSILLIDDHPPPKRQFTEHEMSRYGSCSREVDLQGLATHDMPQPPLVRGTVRDLFPDTNLRKGRAVLNSLSNPMPDGELPLPPRWQDIATHSVAYREPVANTSTPTLPTGHLVWGLITTPGARTWAHFDTDATVLSPVVGTKVLALGYPRDSDSMAGDFTTRHLQFEQVSSNTPQFRWEFLVLAPGMHLYVPLHPPLFPPSPSFSILRMGTPHWVYSFEHCIVDGRHFHNSAAIQASINATLQNTIAPTLTNASSEYAHQMLLRIFLYQADAILRDDIPELHFVDFVALAAFVVLLPALDPQAYEKNLLSIDANRHRDITAAWHLIHAVSLALEKRYHPIRRFNPGNRTQEPAGGPFSHIVQNVARHMSIALILYITDWQTRNGPHPEHPNFTAEAFLEATVKILLVYPTFQNNDDWPSELPSNPRTRLSLDNSLKNPEPYAHFIGPPATLLCGLVRKPPPPPKPAQTAAHASSAKRAGSSKCPAADTPGPPPVSKKNKPDNPIS